MGIPVTVSGTVTANPPTLPATYSAVAGVTAAASPTDVLIIQGSASKTVRVRRISLNGSQTTGGVRGVYIVRRSSAASGGTPVAATAIPYDSASAAATATVTHFTANPTVGTAVGSVAVDYVFIPAATANGRSIEFVWPGSDVQAVTLRGTSEYLAVNLGGVASSGLVFGYVVEWTEE